MIQKKTACNRDCPDACGMLATIEKGRVVQLQGDPEHPVTQGFLCHRTQRYLRRQYDDRRVTQALIRRDKGGPNDRWEPVPLDDALDRVADKMLQYRRDFGPAAILNYRCGGSMGMMKYVTDYFFQQFGPVTIKSGDICAGAGDWAQAVDFGRQDSNDYFDLLNANTIFLWGKNVYVSQVHLLPVLQRARKQGARLVLIDPVRHRTAQLCDLYVPVEPGGDAPLALGIARWLRDHDQLDPGAPSYCDHWDEYLALLGRHTAAEWAAMAGVTAQQLEQLALAYADGPTSILIGWGMQRRRNGAAIIRTIDALAAASGNLGIRGGGASFYYPRKGAYDLSFLDDDLAPRAIPEPLLGQGIEEAEDPPIKMVFVSAANPVTNLPDSNTVARALNDRFTVVVDMFLTDTAECADVFLPAASMLEDDDLLGAYGHHYLNAVQPVVPPPGDALTDYQLLQRLGKRVGLEAEFSVDAGAWQDRIARPLREAGHSLDQLRQGTVRNPLAAEVVFEGRRFDTPTGRVNLITDYRHPASRLNPEFPLTLMALATGQAQAAQWQAEQQQGPAALTVHPGAANGFREGQTVRVESPRGALEVQLKFSDRQRLDVALMDKGGWLAAGRCANAITPAELSDHGECAVYYETPVRLVRRD